MVRLSRREFLGLAGATVALGTGCNSPGTGSQSGPLLRIPHQRRDLAAFDHIVVLMMENRSFDQLLGYLYEPDTVPRGQAFDGVVGKHLANPIPADAEQAARQEVPVHWGAVMDHPSPDPGEEYPHVNTQLYGTTLPAANRHQPVAHMAAPFNVPDPLPAQAPMSDFVTDYIHTLQRATGRAPTYEEYRIIMACFPPAMVPVLSTLARQFAVCDHWHAAVPSQTFPNRAFFHTASSSGLVVNDPVLRWYEHNTAETIFDRLEARRARGLSWKVYYDKREFFSYTGLIHHARLRHYAQSHFAGMHRFFTDVETGHLPSYAFVEPRILYNHNDMHPPTHALGHTFHSSVLAGELLIHQVYDAIRRSASRQGNNFQNTLLVITFDEHGGCYDHVAPPAAVPPDPNRPVGQMGFRFDRLGVRVPTILVSAYIEPGTVLNTPLEHTSIIKTLSEKWALGHLTERDKSANDIREAFNRVMPRRQHEWPVTVPRPLRDEGATNLSHRLHAMQQSFVALADAHDGKPELHRHEVNTAGDAVQFLQRKTTPFTAE
jgi:phospholipase C